MFLLRQPSGEVIQRFISAQSKLPFSYPQVGATQTHPPAGYTVDHNRIELGRGKETYMRAVSALKSWKHFDLGWVKIVPADVVVEVGAVVGVLARAFGLWSLNGCRVVYVIEEEVEGRAKFGFAYGTLPDHVECGEERFTVEWHDDDSVWYDIYAFSQPQHAMVKLGFPFARMLQRRFARESLAAMVAASR